MTKLNSISISNVRRFSDDVTLNVSSGATIILAPNGTGKTSIFEAIELALTGAVKRLAKPPDALIRDGLTNAKIRLNFDSSQYCEAIFNRGSNPQINIQHADLFGNVERNNIPFLLRLTHLLNQNSKDWFVQSTGTAAAEQLDSLAIGKDAQYVYGNITSLKRSSTILLDNVQKEFGIVNEQLESWRSLIGRRASMTAVSETGLIPKKDLIKRIQELNSKEPKKISEQIPAINGLLNEVGLQITQSIATIQGRLVNLESLKSTIQSYSQVTASLLEAQKNLRDKNTEIESKQASIQDLTNKTNDETKLRDEAKANISTQRTILSNIVRLNEASILLASLRQNLASFNEQLVTALKQLQDAESLFKGHSEKSRVAKGILARKTVVDKQKNDLQPLRALVNDWKKLEISLEEYRSRLVGIEERVKKGEQDVTNADLAVKSATSTKDTLESRLANLTETSDTIKQAVTIIVSNLPNTEKNCPVCLTEYEPTDLQERMARALTAINAEITPINEALQKSKEDLERVTKSLKDAKAVLVAVKNERIDVQSKVDQAINNITSNKNKFQSANDSGSASLEFENRLKEITQSEESINKELLELKDVPSDTDLASAESDFRSRSASKTQLEANIVSVNKQIGDQDRIVSGLQLTINANESKESVESKIFELEQKERLHEEKRKEWANKLTQENELQQTYKAQLISLQTNVQQLDFRKSELVNLWQQSELKEEPNSISLTNAQKESEQQLKKFQANQEILQSISPELSKWQAYEDYFKFESEIKTRIGEFSEEEFTSKLKSQQEAAQKKLSVAQNNNEILVTFSRFLDEEIETINTRLEAINPTLGRILKRLTVDPRFAETNISSYQYYKKNHADIKVPLHGSTALVAHVASEAQITDVQFSFLLAMAQTYQWSPWKALLLDDPTQHHDLVHASSVFDILRDYIVDHGFQVVLATHDSVQAKFFMRKLQNDGIPCSLYNLRSTELGVIAEVG
jgi:exonuclease SbcC